MSTAAALEPQTRAAAADAKKRDEAKQPRDPFREVIETVVFVVVLVLLLKLFVTEAFVIPTGSMAETLYGYQKVVSCAKCGHEFPVNSHDEVEGQKGVRMPLVSYCCPNCRHAGQFADLPVQPQNRTGDRVLVLKPLYHLRRPERGDVVVFKYPQTPQENHVASNYIKRAMGFGGETVAIFRGELYVTTTLDYSDATAHPRPNDPNDLWRESYQYGNSKLAEELFEKSRLANFPNVPGGFQIVRKSEAHLLADLRIVWDNDKQPAGAPFAPRWQVAQGSAGWKGDTETATRAFGHTGNDLDWLRYQHLVWKQDAGGARLPWRWPQDAAQPVAGPVDNVLGYNDGVSLTPTNELKGRENGTAPNMWVGDLCLECEVQLDAGAVVVLELSKGARRFQAQFGGGQVALSRVDANRNADPAFAPTARACKVAAGTYKLRFANIDNRLWVWVDGKRIDFGTDGDYTTVEPGSYDAEDTAKEGWVRANDIDAPASIGAKGSVPAVRAIKLHRDVYYSHQKHRRADEPETYYVQPGHYMCLGDNSAQSSDSRTWGVVPERLMLGKAVFVFWPGPFESTGSYPWNVRWDWNKNRIGFIK
jgi:signal peptidase I